MKRNEMKQKKKEGELLGTSRKVRQVKKKELSLMF